MPTPPMPSTTARPSHWSPRRWAMPISRPRLSTPMAAGGEFRPLSEDQVALRPNPLRRDTMRKRTVKLWRLHEDGRKLFAGTIEAADPRELVLKWSAFLATAERGTYFATYRGSFVGPEPALENSDTLAA